jgi:hypothetical protein
MLIDPVLTIFLSLFFDEKPEIVPYYTTLSTLEYLRIVIMLQPSPCP